ncbi:MAG: hypothetical protein AAFW73_18705 [Bacteroidota bacterium]
MLIQKNNRFSFALVAVLMIALVFAACTKQEHLAPQSPQEVVQKETVFQKHLQENTQRLVAEDLGSGRYHVVGAQGTVVNIDNALVNAAGERVRGTVEIELIEIYDPVEMMLNRKQTLADYDGRIELLQSGGEVFVQVYQNGEELRLDGQGEMQLLLPTANTGGAKENMELYYGDEVGEQVMWKPTGEKVEVVRSQDRSDIEAYLVLLQGMLGWINVDIIYAYPGTPVNCIQFIIDCDLPCAIDPSTAFTAIYIPGLNSAFELTQVSHNEFTLCGQQGAVMTLGGAPATFVFALDCGHGYIYTIMVTTIISSSGNHVEIVDCSMMQTMDYPGFQNALEAML